jgi:hypothetical protein
MLGLSNGVKEEMESKKEWELRRKRFKDSSTHRPRWFFQESSQPHLASSLAGGQNIQDWKEEKVGRFYTPRTGAGCRSKGHQIQVFEPC